MSPSTTFAAAATPADAARPALSHANAGAPHWWQALWQRREGRVHEIRRLMAAQLAAVAHEPTRAALASKIGAAQHPQELWVLREELHAVLVPAHGELLARQRMTDISFMFAGLLQGRTRPAPVVYYAAVPPWMGSDSTSEQALGGGAARLDH